MEAIISNFRRGKHTQTTNQLILVVESEDLSSLIGKEVIYKTETGKEIKGKITNLHGKNAVRALFEKGIPGQALGKKVIIK